LIDFACRFCVVQTANLCSLVLELSRCSLGKLCCKMLFG
jgi:hypothetical protein